jgi:hypothetical protein
MTGFYIRIRTEHGWRAVEVEELTREQWAELEKQQPLDGWRWARALATWIRERVTVAPEQLPAGELPVASEGTRSPSPLATGNSQLTTARPTTERTESTENADTSSTEGKCHGQGSTEDGTD